jgi:hypothetical protein
MRNNHHHGELYSTNAQISSSRKPTIPTSISPHTNCGVVEFIVPMSFAVGGAW